MEKVNTENLSSNTIHRGEIVRRVVDGCGVKITAISASLGLSRNTLYNKFTDPNLSEDFIFRIGDKIRYDFSRDIPNLSERYYSLNEDLKSKMDQALAQSQVEKKYIKVLEQNKKILSLLTKILSSENKDKVMREIKEFIENDGDGVLD